jgi:hypothetical protein
MNNKAKMLILLMVTTLFSVSLQAQEKPERSWENLNRLQAGQKVKVLQMDMKFRKGRFLGFTDEMISLRIKKDEVAVPRDEVMRVSLRGKRSRVKSALAGMGLGAALGAVALMASCGGRYACGGEPGLWGRPFRLSAAMKRFTGPKERSPEKLGR